MGTSDVGAALEKMATDPDAVDRMAAGDFSDLSDADLTEAERAMVAAAAADIPEVDGFASLQLGDLKSEPLGGAGAKWSPNVIAAARYAGFVVVEGEVTVK